MLGKSGRSYSLMNRLIDVSACGDTDCCFPGSGLLSKTILDDYAVFSPDFELEDNKHTDDLCRQGDLSITQMSSKNRDAVCSVSRRLSSSPPLFLPQNSGGSNSSLKERSQQKNG